MDKRGQGLPITTVILAILGIVVLVILFAIITGRLTIFTGVANECPGVCIVSDEDLTVKHGGVNPVPGILESHSIRSDLECKPNIEKRIFWSCFICC